jgi:hypothetical protein
MRKCSLQFAILRNLETTGRNRSFMFFRIRFYPERQVASSFAKFYLSTRLRDVTLPNSVARRHLIIFAMALEGNASQESLFCACSGTDNVAVSHELYSSNSFTPGRDWAWGKSNTVHIFREYHPLKLRHLLDYSTAKTTNSNTVYQHPLVFCIYEYCISSDMKLPLVATTGRFQKERNELD